MMKLIQLIAVMMLFLQSCNRNNEEQICCINVDIAFEIQIIDSLGNDLLNYKNDNSFNHSEISYYKLDNDGNKVNIFSPEHFIIPPSDYLSKYFLNITEIGMKQPDGSYLSYLKLSSDVTDTIKVRTIENNGSTYKDKIWYNDKLVWERIHLNTLSIIITK